MKKKAVELLLNKALFYLGVRMRTTHEMRMYLEKKAERMGGTASDIEEVLLLLNEKQYLNDKAFVDTYVNSRNRSKPKGSYILRQELSAKGVPTNLIDQYFETHEHDALRLAKQAITTRWPLYQRFDRQKGIRRAQDFLSRRGFPYDIIRETIDWAKENL